MFGVFFCWNGYRVSFTCVLCVCPLFERVNVTFNISIQGWHLTLSLICFLLPSGIVVHYDEVMNNKSGGEGGQGEGSRGLMSTVDVIIVPLSKKCAFGGMFLVYFWYYVH